jgi:medium-chain acyl-[acyl-carrier-protein] hydrolase
MTTINEASIWFPNVKFDPQASLRLFCFPYAGGSNLIFRNWSANLPPQIEVCPVQLPGRGNRLREPGYTNMQVLAKALAPLMRPVLNKPFAFFGHSMGATLAFELSRELRRSDKLQPVHFFASGRMAPHIPREEALTYDLPEPEFIANLRKINGTPNEVLEHPELMQMMMPLLRADFEMVETYEYEPDAPLDYPITALGGLQDQDIPREHLEAWRQHTNAPFSLRMLPGDHFFINTAQSLIHLVLAQALYQYIR